MASFESEPLARDANEPLAGEAETHPDRSKFRQRDDNPLEQQKERAFVDWLTENGAKFGDTVELRSYEEEVRGVHAARDIGNEEILMEIPLCCLITVEMGKATDAGKAVLRAELELDAPKHVFLMLFLLLDRLDERSFFRPYYDLLPATLSNMPIFWSEQELALLEGSYLVQQIADRTRAIELDYEQICDCWPSMRESCSMDDFKWARMCVCSRNFGVVVNGVRTSALVPYADMLNHLRPRETKWTYDNARGAFTITSLMPLCGGAQIYDSYGQKCNHRFLLNYGFAIEDNAEPDGFCPNEAAVPLELDPCCDAEVLRKKELLWARDGTTGPKRVRVCGSDNENFRAALSLLRVVLATEDELEHILGANPYASYRTASDVHFPVSLRNELAILERLGEITSSMLAQYPRSIAEDDAALREGLAPFSNERHACIHVRSEKLVLQHYIDFSRIALEFAKLERDEFDAAINEIFDEPRHRHVAAYCNGVLRQVRRFERRRAPSQPPAARVLDPRGPIDLTAPTIV